MADPLTANKFLAQPVPGSDVGTWGTPMNNNAGIIDASFGGVATIPLLGSNVVLNAAQYQNCFIVLTGAITANVTVTLPPVGSFYTVQNLTTNSSAFHVTLNTTAAGGQVISTPPGETTDIFTDAVNVKFKNLHRIGEYWDHAGSSVPAWVTACTVPPYLNCDGSAFSSATYPYLFTMFTVGVLPDLRGRFRSYLNQGTGRLQSSNGVNGDQIGSAGGNQATVISSQHIPNYALPVTDPGHSHTTSLDGQNVFHSGGSQETPGSNNSKSTTLWSMNNAVTGITVNSGGGGLGIPIIPPTMISGITMIRAG